MGWNNLPRLKDNSYFHIPEWISCKDEGKKGIRYTIIKCYLVHDIFSENDDCLPFSFLVLSYLYITKNCVFC